MWRERLSVRQCVDCGAGESGVVVHCRDGLSTTVYLVRDCRMVGTTRVTSLVVELVQGWVRGDTERHIPVDSGSSSVKPVLHHALSNVST